MSKFRHVFDEPVKSTFQLLGISVTAFYNFN